MLTCMIEIDDVSRAREVLIGDIPDPLGSVTDHHLLIRPAPAAFPGFGIDAGAERLGGFDCADISRGGLVSHPPAFLIRRGFSEDASHVSLAGARRLSLQSAPPALHFPADHP